MSFQLPLELMLLANLALSLNLCLPLPLSKPGVAIVRFSTTPVGQGMTAAAFSILLLLLIQPLYDMNSLNKQKEVAAETITHKDGRCVADGRVIVQTVVGSCPSARPSPNLDAAAFGLGFIITIMESLCNIRTSRCRSVEASAHLAMFLTATNMALPIINRTLGLVKGQIGDLRQKYETKTA